VQVARANSIIASRLVERTVGEQHASRSVATNLEQRVRKLKALGLGDHLVDPAA